MSLVHPNPTASDGKVHRYLYYTTSHDDGQPFTQLDQVPNIVMTICVNVLSVMKENGAGHVRLYRPVSSATAITIIETPFHHGDMSRSSMAHDLCVQMLHMSSMMQMSGLLGPEQPEYMFGDDIPMSKECMEQREKPAIRSVTDIRKVILVKGACLHDRPPAHLASVKTNLRLHNLEVKSSGGGVLYKDLYKTSFKLLKMASIQVNPKNLEQAERRLLPEHGFGNARFGSSTCLLRMGYTEWHANLSFPLAIAEAFVKRVCILPSVHVWRANPLRSQLRFEAGNRPEILLNRVHLTIVGQVGQEAFHNLLAECHDVYTSKITGMYLVLPSRSNPPEIFRCDTLDSEKKVKWSGSIKVIARKRGVLVKLEVNDGNATVE